MKHTLILCFLFTATIQFACSQQKKNDDITGAWKGTSICQVKNSPCNDEVVVYHISKAKAANAYDIQANKIVNGVEEDMGTLNGTYDNSKKMLVCHYENKRGQKSTWEFNISGKEIKGRLLMEDKTLYRLIELKKQF